jgi:hypothetical protein
MISPVMKRVQLHRELFHRLCYNVGLHHQSFPAYPLAVAKCAFVLLRVNASVETVVAGTIWQNLIRLPTVRRLLVH